ncbi:MAG: ATP-dependent helicase [Afipia sp.]|nr:ATP-dependent helicase [Afipia sp.]
MTQLALLPTSAPPRDPHRYGRLARDPMGSWIISDVPPHISLRLKQIFPRIPRTAIAPFTLTESDALCADLLWFTERYPLEMTAADANQLRGKKQRFDKSRLDFERIMLPEYRPGEQPGFRPGMQPYPYQAQAIELTRLRRRLLLLDDVGLGKTISALGVLCDPSLRPAAIVVESHLAEQWLTEYVETFTTLRGHIIKGTKPYDLPAADVYIFKYSNIFGWVDIAATALFKAVVFDEIQSLRGGAGTAKGAAAKVFATHADVRMGLTATPIYNYGAEIFQVVEFIESGALGTPYEFYTEWCTSGGKDGMVRDPKALGTYLREMQLVIRRTEDDVSGQMPPLNVVSMTIEHDEQMAEDAEERARALAIKVTSGSFIERGSAARELDAFARHTTGVAKARSVAAYVRVLLESRIPVLLAGWHREVYDIWLEDLADFRPAMYTGTETSVQKTAAKHAFINGDTDLMIISLRSGAGLDGLQKRGSTVVFGELDWSPQVHRQVIGRLRRPGQTRQVDVIYLHSDSGSDPLMIEVLGVKASQARNIIDPLSGAEEVFSDTSRVKALAEAYLKSKGT